MNHDNPKLTAYAFNELPPEDRAEIEALLQEQPAAAEEVAQTEEMAGIMRKLFRAELTETLTPRRREAVLAAARVQLAPASAPPPANVITPHPAWWRRTSTLQWAAACVVFGFGVYAISSALMSPSPTPGTLARNPGVEVGIHGLVNTPPTNDGHQPNMVVPPENKASAGLTNNVLPTPGGRIGMEVKSNTPTVEVPKLDSIPRNAVAVTPVTPRIQPTVVNGNPAPGREFLNSAGASLGHPRPLKGPTYGSANPGVKTMLPGDLGEVTLTAEEASRYYASNEFLNARWQEASSVREGNTYADLALHFRRDGGSQGPEAQRFVMIRCPFIKVDVKFGTESESTPPWPVTPETRIKTISKPYFEPEQGR